MSGHLSDKSYIICQRDPLNFDPFLELSMDLLYKDRQNDSCDQSEIVYHELMD